MITPTTGYARDVKTATLNAMKSLVYSLRGPGQFQYTVTDEKQYLLLLDDQQNIEHEFIRLEPLTGNIAQDCVALTSWFETVVYKIDAEKGGLYDAPDATQDTL